MAQVVITAKLMPTSPEVDLAAMCDAAKDAIMEFTGEKDPEGIKTEEEPVAFGLKALKLVFVADESKGSTEPLENSLSDIKDVESVEIIDVRRAIG